MNKLNNLVMKIKMFITSYFPLYFIMIVLNTNEYKLLSYNEMNEYTDIKVTIFMCIMLFFIIVSIFCTMELCLTKGAEIHKFKDIEKTGDSIISYMMSYIIPLISDDFFSFKAIVINTTLFVTIGIMYVKLNLIYFNPLWLLCGYVVYNAADDFIIITNIDYTSLKQCEEEGLRSTFLANRIYLIRKKDNIQNLK